MDATPGNEPWTVNQLTRSPATSGVFYYRDWALSHSPEHHQNLPPSTPELCTELHQHARDLEGVEGATPQDTTPLTPGEFDDRSNF